MSLLALPLAPALIPAAVALSLSLLAHPFDRPAPRAVRAAFLLALLALLAGLALDLFWFLP